MPLPRIPVLAATLFLLLVLTRGSHGQDLEATLKKVKIQNADCIEVVTIVPKGLAARLGLKEGDVIQEVNRKLVRSQAEVLEAIGSSRWLEIKVLHSGRLQTIQAEIYWPPAKKTGGQK